MFLHHFRIFHHFCPAAAHAEYLQLVPAGDFPLISNVGSAHHTQKLIRDSECWMVIGWCKKLNRGQWADQSHGPYISWCLCQKHHNLPCFGSSNLSVAPSSGKFWYSNMALKQPEVIKVPDDDDFPDSGPQSPVEAQSLQGQPRCHNEHLSDLLADNHKDTLRSTITSLKKLMVKHWWQMVEADMDAVLKSIHNPSCIYLHQHLTTKGIDMMEPVTEVPEGWTFLRQLPKKVQKMEVQELIMMCFCLRPTCHPWPRLPTPRPSTWSWRWLLNQWFRSMSQSVTWVWSKIPPPKMTAEECLSQLEKVLLPWPSSLAWEPWYGPTWLLAAAIWLCLKHKFFNGGTAKEACTMFEVQAKQLSKLLSGKVYLSGSARATKGKWKWSHTVAHEGDMAGDDPPLSPHQEVNEVCHHCKSLSLHSLPRRCHTTVGPPSPQWGVPPL